MRFTSHILFDEARPVTSLFSCKILLRFVRVTVNEAQAERESVTEKSILFVASYPAVKHPKRFHIAIVARERLKISVSNTFGHGEF